MNDTSFENEIISMLRSKVGEEENPQFILDDQGNSIPNPNYKDPNAPGPLRGAIDKAVSGGAVALGTLASLPQLAKKIEVKHPVNVIP